MSRPDPELVIKVRTVHVHPEVTAVLAAAEARHEAAIAVLTPEARERLERAEAELERLVLGEF